MPLKYRDQFYNMLNELKITRDTIKYICSTSSHEIYTQLYQREDTKGYIKVFIKVFSATHSDWGDMDDYFAYACVSDEEAGKMIKDWYALVRNLK